MIILAEISPADIKRAIQAAHRVGFNLGGGQPSQETRNAVTVAENAAHAAVAELLNLPAAEIARICE